MPSNYKYKYKMSLFGTVSVLKSNLLVGKYIVSNIVKEIILYKSVETRTLINI